MRQNECEHCKVPQMMGLWTKLSIQALNGNHVFADIIQNAFVEVGRCAELSNKMLSVPGSTLSSLDLHPLEPSPTEDSFPSSVSHVFQLNPQRNLLHSP